MRDIKPTFFATPEAFRAWLDRYHLSDEELWVGFHKRATSKLSITWPQSVDEALSFGWIDGVRVSIDSTSYAIRFTPRRPRSTWSAVNIARVKELVRLGRMRPAGLAKFKARADERSAIYSYEQRHTATLDPADERRFRRNKKAWEFFQAQAPSYRKTVTYWVVSAKRAETKAKRLAVLMADSAKQRRVGQFTRPGKKG